MNTKAGADDTDIIELSIPSRAFLKGLPTTTAGELEWHVAGRKPPQRAIVLPKTAPAELDCSQFALGAKEAVRYIWGPQLRAVVGSLIADGLQEAGIDPAKVHGEPGSAVLAIFVADGPTSDFDRRDFPVLHFAITHLDDHRRVPKQWASKCGSIGAPAVWHTLDQLVENSTHYGSVAALVLAKPGKCGTPVWARHANDAIARDR